MEMKMMQDSTESELDLRVAAWLRAGICDAGAIWQREGSAATIADVEASLVRQRVAEGLPVRGVVEVDVTPLELPDYELRGFVRDLMNAPLRRM